MKKLSFIPITLLLFAAQANAQMVMEWQSSAGMQSANSVYVQEIPSGSRLDFNGDGFNDIPIFNWLRGDDQFGVISGKDPNTTWQFPLPAPAEHVPTEDLSLNIIGFFDVDNSNGTEKEVILATKSSGIKVWRDPLVVNQSGLVKRFGDQYLLLGIADYDKDNDLEMLGGADTPTRVLELWGKGN